MAATQPLEKRAKEGAARQEAMRKSEEMQRECEAEWARAGLRNKA